MTAARAAQIDLKATFFYHCMTRCKRGSFLSGFESQTRRDFNHRKRWLIARIKKLTDIFAIKVCGYAVMNSHYHLILYIDPAQTLTWQDEEVKTRWSKLFPRDAKRWEKEACAEEILMRQIIFWRERLCSISWFMRCLNEYIARLSNKEEGRTGRFWQSRFKSQPLLEQNPLLAMVKTHSYSLSELSENNKLCLCVEETPKYHTFRDYFSLEPPVVIEERYGTFLTAVTALEKNAFDWG